MTKIDIDKICRIEGKSFVVKCNLIKVYIPNEYIERRISEIIGDEISTFGLFEFDVQLNEGDKFHRFFYKCPSIIRMQPSRIIEERNENKEIVNVLEFTEGDKFIETIDLERNWKIGSAFLDIIFNGYMPKKIPYDEVVELWKEVNRISGLDLQVTSSDMEITIAEMSRNPRNLKELFRLLLAKKPDTKLTSKKMVRLMLLGKLNSTFSAVSGGDPRQGITMSINRERYGEHQNESPVEAAIK